MAIFFPVLKHRTHTNPNFFSELEITRLKIQSPNKTQGKRYILIKPLIIKFKQATKQEDILVTQQYLKNRYRDYITKVLKTEKSMKKIFKNKNFTEKTK